ncbi:MAG: precorrin-2 C(20)-methyltransferase [Planctomycetota bacterium]|jgi:precorrin-2/cobalt-factor-2 C20-methyltransferase
MEYYKNIKAEKGTFYTVGLGPGNSELVTMRAAGIISSSDVIIAPKSRVSKESMALSIAKPFITENQEIIEHIYAMEKDEEKALASWRAVAEKIKEKIEEGLSVCHITIGDPLIYSTSYYLLESLREMIDNSKIKIVPGISAFQAVASKFNEALTIQRGRLAIMTAYDIKEVEAMLDNCETLVLYKIGQVLEDLVPLLKKRDLLMSTKVAVNVECEGKEVVTEDITELLNSDKKAYMATAVIHTGKKSW